jgi:GNAT superfamily N-acetyltransferase
MRDSLTCRTLQKEDEKEVRRLVESSFPIFSLGKFWDWRYLRNPNFDRSMVAVAEIDGKIVGCNHWIPRRVKLSGTAVLDSMLGGNIAVVPEYRKKGVGKALIYFLRSLHNSRRPSLLYMFTDNKLPKHFHTPVGGYIPAPSGTTLYARILNWNKLKTNVAAFNCRVKRGEFKDQLAKVDLTVVFKVHAAPPLCLHLYRQGVNILTSLESSDVTMLSDLSTLEKIREENAGLRILIITLLKGRLKFKGSIRKMLDLYRNRRILEEILGREIT